MVEADAPDEVAIGVATAGPRATAAAITARTSFTCSPGEGRTDTGLRSGLSVPCAVRFRSPEELHVFPCPAPGGARTGRLRALNVRYRTRARPPAARPSGSRPRRTAKSG